MKELLLLPALFFIYSFALLIIVQIISEINSNTKTAVYTLAFSFTLATLYFLI